MRAVLKKSPYSIICEICFSVYKFFFSKFQFVDSEIMQDTREKQIIQLINPHALLPHQIIETAVNLVYQNGERLVVCCYSTINTQIKVCKNSHYVIQMSFS